MAFEDITAELDAEQTAAIIAEGIAMRAELYCDALGAATALSCEACTVIGFAGDRTAWKAEVRIDGDVEIQVLARDDRWTVGDAKSMVAICPDCAGHLPVIARVTLPAVAAL